MVDANGYTEVAPVRHAAGNMTYDDVFRYAYDARTQQTKVIKAYRTGNVPAGAQQRLGHQRERVRRDVARHAMGLPRRAEG